MMSIKTYKHTIYPLLGILALPACREEMDLPNGWNDSRTPIELSVGVADASPATRAVISDGTGKTLKAFAADTRLFIKMKADADGQAAKYAMYCATAQGETDAESAVQTATGNYLYWEDAYARDTKLSVYAVAIPGKSPASMTIGNTTCGDSPMRQNFATTSDGLTVAWHVGDATSHKQTATTFDVQDLCFSNNIADWSSVTGKADDRMDFNFDGDRKFDKGNLIFYHALSMFTIHVCAGGGFTLDAGHFNFTNATGTIDNDGTNIQLTGYNVSGNFDLSQGVFTSPASGNVPSLYNAKIDKAAASGQPIHTLKGYVLPGTDMNVTAEGMRFNIDANHYIITKQQIYEAICHGIPSGKTKGDYFDGTSGSESLLKAGVHYILKLTIGKSKVEHITAQLVPWEEVNAGNVNPTNAHVNLNLLAAGAAQEEGVDFYRGLNLYSGSDFNHEWKSYDWPAIQYEKAEAHLVKTTDSEYVRPEGSSDDHDYWTTDWSWESNHHFYHFRSVMPAGTAIDGNATDPYHPTLALQAARVTSASSYKDVCWGAPFLNTTSKLTYSKTYGFDGTAASTSHQIYWAIGPTDDEIKLISFHLMSEIAIELTTTDDAAAISFGDGASGKTTTVELRECASTGTANLGDGCVTSGSTVTTQTLADDLHAGNLTLKWGVIPQSLTGKELRIVTPDGNEYLVDLGKIKVTKDAANPSNTNLANPYEVVDGKCTIDYWYPNYKYKYTFKLTKKGITDLRATIVNWETVTADEETVTIQ